MLTILENDLAFLTVKPACTIVMSLGPYSGNGGTVRHYIVLNEPPFDGLMNKLIFCIQ